MKLDVLYGNVRIVGGWKSPAKGCAIEITSCCWDYG